MWLLWGRREVHLVFLQWKHEARDHTEGVAVHGKLVLKCVFEKGDDGGDVNWVRLA